MEIREYDTLDRFAEMQSNLRALLEYRDNGRKSIELRVQRWATPFGLLPLAMYADENSMDITYGRNSDPVKRYLRNIYFPKGATQISELRETNYLPLSKLSVDFGDDYLTRYEDMILDNISDEGIRSSFQNSLKYLTSEIVTNIKEHAETDCYWIMSQYWPKSNTCEIVIADAGVGYLGSYVGTPFEVDSHEEAIMNAIRGNSSKNDVERGTGIPSVIKIFCEGYGGCVLIMSGDRLLFMEGERNVFYPLEVDWGGVFFGIRFELSVVNALAYLAGNFF